MANNLLSILNLFIKYIYDLEFARLTSDLNA
jgi:hypothetical protein